MANTVPSNPVGVDTGDLLAGEGLNESPVGLLGQANNYILARAGTGTPRIAQIFPRQGSTTPAGTFVVNTVASAANARWRIPDTLGATSVRCWVYGSSLLGLGTVQWKSLNAAASTVAATLPTTPGLVDCGTLTIDAAGGSEDVQLWVSGSGGHDVTIDGVMVTVEPLSSPLATARDAAGRLPFDAGELATPQALNAAQGYALRDNLSISRLSPHVYASWSGIRNATASGRAKYMISAPHVIPSIVWPDSLPNGWTLTCWVYAKNGTGVDLEVHIGAAAALGDINTSGYGTPARLAVITIPAGAEGWYSATLARPQSRFLQVLPNGWLSCALAIWPEPGKAGAVAQLQSREGGSAILSTAQIESVAVWGY